MSILGMIKRNLRQTAVYWGNPVNNGRGSFTFDEPIEIACRWENKNEVYSSKDNSQLISSAIVYTQNELTTEGYLMLGALTDLDSSNEDSPKSIDGAYLIKKIDKISSLNNPLVFIKKIYL
jgi:hypothetical protein